MANTKFLKNSLLNTCKHQIHLKIENYKQTLALFTKNKEHLRENYKTMI